MEKVEWNAEMWISALFAWIKPNDSVRLLADLKILNKYVVSPEYCRVCTVQSLRACRRDMNGWIGILPCASQLASQLITQRQIVPFDGVLNAIRTCPYQLENDDPIEDWPLLHGTQDILVKVQEKFESIPETICATSYNWQQAIWRFAQTFGIALQLEITRNWIETGTIR